MSKPVLITGATGYVGGRLAPLLLEQGHRVRAMCRTPSKLACRSWAGHENLEIVPGDVSDPASLEAAFQGVGVVYYLVHSMQPGARDYAETDRRCAENTVRAATAAGVERIIYLSGLTGEAGAGSPELSKHLASRAEVAEILSSGAPRTTTLRAAQILGSGSASFEILRYLADRLPVMITPRWVSTETQPIAVSDVLAYLAGCLDRPETKGRAFDIGGPDILTYKQLFHIYCEEAGLKKRLIIPVPFLTPKLSSYWLGLVTPLPPSLAKPLILGLKNRVVCRDNTIRDIIPRDLLTCRATIARAMNRVAQNTVETSWSDAGALTPPEWAVPGDAPYSGGTVLGCDYGLDLRAEPSQVWAPIARIGGGTGWYAAGFLWKLRGWMDRLLGGPGLRRGRRHPWRIQIGDAIDFWRVLDVRENKRLLLQAEMKLPGEALLEFSIEEKADGSLTLVQRSRFLPRGLLGLAYWYATYPFHVPIFKGMLKAIARRAQAAPLSKPRRLKPEPVTCRLH